MSKNNKAHRAIEEFNQLNGQTFTGNEAKTKAEELLNTINHPEIKAKLRNLIDNINRLKPDKITIKIQSKFRTLKKQNVLREKPKKRIIHSHHVKSSINNSFEKKSEKLITKNYTGSAAELIQQKFEKINLTGDLKKSLGRLYNDTKVLIWGSPGHGKTVKLLKWAMGFAKMGKKVVYVCNEEHGRSTFQEKLIEFKIDHPNLKFVKNISDVENLGWKMTDVDQWFFDSVNTMGMNLKDARNFIDQFPLKNIFFIVQSTKDGGFRGGKDWEHEVDIAGQVINRELRIVKNRLDNSFLDKLKVAETEDEFEKALLRQKIKTKVAETIIKKSKKPKQ